MKAGDRVEYTGNETPWRTGHKGFVVRLDAAGTTAQINWDDGENTCGDSFFCRNLTVIKTTFKVGDRVEVTSPHRFTGRKGVIARPFAWAFAWAPNSNNGNAWWITIDGVDADFFAYDLELIVDDVLRVGDRVEAGPTFPYGRRRGKRGTVSAITDPDESYMRTYIVWDEKPGDRQPCSIAEAKRFIKLQGTSVDIETALKVLRDAGTVTFVPKKPPFKIIPVKVGDGEYLSHVDADLIKVGCQRITFDQFDEVAKAVDRARAYAATA